MGHSTNGFTKIDEQPADQRSREPPAGTTLRTAQTEQLEGSAVPPPPPFPPPPPRTARVPDIKVPSLPKMLPKTLYSPPKILVQEATPPTVTEKKFEKARHLPLGIKISEPLAAGFPSSSGAVVEQKVSCEHRRYNKELTTPDTGRSEAMFG